MTPIVALILGLLIGWLVEWVIDWIYWRRRSRALQDCADQCQQKLATLEGELLSLKSEVLPLQEKANQLELEKAQLELQLMDSQQELEQGRQLETRSAQFQQGFDTLTGPPVVEEPLIPDDLQEIKGIGLVISKRLNSHGIYTFEQLAAQTPDSLRDIVGDMIQRLADEESLIEQARQFALRKLSKGADGQ